PRVGVTAAWQSADFDDSEWHLGGAPFGFGNVGAKKVVTDLGGQMLDVTPSAYFRRGFEVAPALAGSGEQLELAISFNDGFIAFLNGKEIARRNMGAAGMFAYRDQTAFNYES